MIVTYEVILGIQRLVDISGKDLSEPSWDILCEILIAIADNITYYGRLFSLFSINLSFFHYEFLSCR